MKNHRFLLFSFKFLFLIFISCNREDFKTKYAGWELYGGTKDAARYSSLNQIDTNNVKNLTLAWEFKAGELDTANKNQIQCNPIIVNGIVYGSTPKRNIFAVDGATGQLKWMFKPSELVYDDLPYWAGLVRGVSYWQEKDEKTLFASVGGFLFALNPETGQLIPNFGDKGKLDLHDGLDIENAQNYMLTANTPGVIYKDKIIIGMRLSEDTDAAPGHIRAFNVRTGKREWIFHTIPQEGELGHDTWQDKNAWKTVGGANSWAGMSLDEKRGIVFVPTGTANPDFYGGGRVGNNLFANCVLALDANTGKRIWHFQAVHHDVWDRDLSANPNLVTIKKDGKTIDAVAQISKQGFIYLLNRETGEPIYPIEERAVPTDTELAGEVLSPTQPHPTKPVPFVRQHFSENDINTITTTPAEQKEILEKLKKIRKESIFSPPAKQGTMIFPGFDGGGEWGGAAYDPESQTLYVNGSDMPWLMEMVDVPKTPSNTEGGKKPLNIGEAIYIERCEMCHGKDKKGNTDGTIPSLVNVKTKFNTEQIVQIIKQGQRMMPAFPQLSNDEKTVVSQYLLGIKSDIVVKKSVKPYSPYRMNGYNKFMTKSGHPAISPPWGTLNAVNLNTGNILWKVPLGEFDSLKQLGVPRTGTENYGGPAVTAGGLIFIAASKDEKIHAFNKRTGELLWEYKLPAGGYATPSVYSVNGRQYVVIACGGGKMNTKSGDSYVAFALPESK